MSAAPRVLLLEPYLTESHRHLVELLARKLPFDFRVLTMPARKWKWRVRGAALHLARELERAEPADVVFSSAYLSLTDLVALGPAWLREARRIVYFHENQLAYPQRLEREWDFHFGMTNLTTALAADVAVFNTRFNRDSFLEAIPAFLRRFPDYRPLWLAERVAARARVLPPPLDPQEFTGLPRAARADAARIAWNHRWEYDKNPDEFFAALAELERRSLPFELVVLGREFRDRPPIFDRARERFAGRIVHWGYAPSRADYLALLASCDLVVSTALHEFFGLAVMEAVRCGCTPLLPERLAYPELFPREHLYADGQLVPALVERVENVARLRREDPRALAAPWEWPRWAAAYAGLFERAGDRDSP
ncbi:MAG: DUF3524 domain-containing protein [Acidobacteria bacterium]|nr:DUF3524 domain-containing protein [Acidobacteriota bacterium]